MQIYKIILHLTPHTRKKFHPNFSLRSTWNKQIYLSHCEKDYSPTWQSHTRTVPRGTRTKQIIAKQKMATTNQLAAIFY